MKNNSKIILFTTILLFQAEHLLATKVTFLSELEEHRTLLKKALTTATDSIVIVSPYISNNALDNDAIPKLVKAAQNRGVKITVYTDFNFDMLPGGVLKPHAEAGRDVLKDLLCDLHVVQKVHAKTLIVDDEWMATGSFNWLSASRNQYWANLEHSVVMEPEEGDTTHEFITKAKTSIRSLVNLDHPYKNFYDRYIDGVFQLQDSEDLVTWISNHQGNFSFEYQQYFSDKIVDFQRKYYSDVDDEVSSEEEAALEEEDPSDGSQSSNSTKTKEKIKEAETKEDKDEFIRNLRDTLYNVIDGLYQAFKTRR